MPDPSPSFATPWQKLWRPEQIGTLVFLRQHDEVLLIHKKTGHGAGLINAPGGKLQPGETVMQCAVREVQEEVGVTPANLICRAELRFVEQQGEQWLGFVFFAHEFTGAISESDEARPFWQKVSEIPYPQMWPDDAIWLPLLLADEQKFQVANFLFDQGQLRDHEFVFEASIWQDLYLGMAD